VLLAQHLAADSTFDRQLNQVRICSVTRGRHNADVRECRAREGGRGHHGSRDHTGQR